MAQKSERVQELEQGLLEVGELIDNCEQSRNALADTMEGIREKVAGLYGEDFENDLLEHEGYEVYDDDDDLQDDE